MGVHQKNDSIVTGCAFFAAQAKETAEMKGASAEVPASVQASCAWERIFGACFGEKFKSIEM